MATDPRAITLQQLSAASANFRQNFRIDPTTRPGHQEEWMPWTDLTALVAGSGVTGLRGIVIYYGLQGTALLYGFRVIELVPLVNDPEGYLYSFKPAVADGDAGQYPTHVYDSASGDLEPLHDPITEWKPLADAYRNTMQVDRTGTGNYTNLIPDVDALKAVFPWESELFLLWQQNQAGLNGHEAWVRWCSIAVTVTDAPAGYRHGVSFNMRYELGGNWVDLVSNTPQQLPYTERGADYGNLCPIRCKKYAMPS